VPPERQTLAVVIPTKDAAALLGDTLESVKWADELIVVDMNSTDGTDDICARFPNCRVFKRLDYIEANANFGFDQSQSDWVLRLDSDERLTPELAREIQGMLAAPPAGVDGFALWERVRIFRRELRHGWGRKHFKKLLFRRGTARYPAETEHQSLAGPATWQRMKHGFIHENYLSVTQYLAKMDYYTTNDAVRADLPAEAPPVRHAVKETARAFYLYYLKWRGYRDGWIGFVDASMRAVYQLVYWAKLRERWERERGELRDA
jgi:glycosyltransferase involved in cell wall biosynthesis